MRKVLNVGGGNKSIPLPSGYDGWEHVLLDIDPRGEPDVVCDARKLTQLPASQYEAVYCSHNLEHYYRHEVPMVLQGFRHVLKPEGFAHIRVPDLFEAMRAVVQFGVDIDDPLYQSPNGPITVRDVLYGYDAEVERSGNEFYAHKTGFTKKSLSVMLDTCGFTHVAIGTGMLEVVAFAFKQKPNDYISQLFKIPQFDH